MAVCALAPTMITLVLAIVADPAHTETAAGWNMLEPRGDDILFVGVVVFASSVAVRLGRNNPALGVLALIVAVACLLRLILEAAGKTRGALEAVGPLLFVVLIATMAVLSFRGVLHARPKTTSWITRNRGAVSIISLAALSLNLVVRGQPGLPMAGRGSVRYRTVAQALMRRSWDQKESPT